MASSVSGADDYASVMYYSHTQYNDSNVAITSSKTELLSTQMMENQSNYTVGIDKMKISSLDGVILSYFPENKLKLGLQLTNDAGTAVYQELTLLKDGQTQFIPQLEHYFCIYTNNSNVVNVFNTTLTPPLNINITLPRLPIKCFYNSVNNYLYYHDNYFIYSYDISALVEYKEDDTTFTTIGIRCMDYNEITNKIVATSGAGFYEFYSISLLGRIVDGENITTQLHTLNNITAIQCGIQNVYVLNNSDINYFSAIQTLYIFNLAGLMILQLDISQYNVIREMECRLEDNILNFYSEGTIANYATNTTGGGYIAPLIGMTVNNVVNRLLTGITNTTAPNISNDNIIGNFVYSLINQNIYASIYTDASKNYGIQKYDLITPIDASVFLVQQAQPISRTMPTNVYESAVYYAKYISYLNLGNVDYLFTSVFKDTLTIEIYVSNTTLTDKTLTKFNVALSGNNPITNDTLIQPSSGAITINSTTQDITGIFSNTISNQNTSNIVYGTGFFYFCPDTQNILTYTMGQLSPNPTNQISLDLFLPPIITSQCDLCAMASHDNSNELYIIIKDYTHSLYKLVHLQTLNSVSLPAEYYLQGAIFSSMSVSAHLISCNMYFTNVDASSQICLLTFNRTDLTINSNLPYDNPIMSFSYIDTNNNVDTYYISVQDTAFYTADFSGNIIRQIAMPGNFTILGFLGTDQFNNLLVSCYDNDASRGGIMAFEKTEYAVQYYFTPYSLGQPIAISRFTSKIPWELYQVINPSYNAVDSNTINNYPLNDATQYITIDEHNNMLLTYCNQEPAISSQGIYCCVKLNPPTLTNNLITLNPTPYIPINITLSYNGSSLGNFSITGLENYNLMYDRNMCCYYARHNDDLLKGFLDNVNNKINFIQYFNFSLLDSVNNPSISTYAKYMYCIENQADYTLQLYPYNPLIFTLQYIPTPISLNNIFTYPQQKYVEIVMGFNIVEKYYIFSTLSNNIINYYTYDGSQMNLHTHKTLPNFSKITNTFGFTVAPVSAKSILAVYSLQEYINSINNAFQAVYTLINTGGFTSTALTAPYVSMDWTTGFITLNYDKTLANVNNGIFVNNDLLNYMKFQVSPSSSPFLSNKYILNSLGKNTQSKFSFLKFNTIDKIIVNSNMSIIGDQVGGNTTSITFSDLDLNMNDPVFLNMSGNFIYDPTLIRNYTLISNQGLRSINYSVVIRYLDKSELPFLIQPGENVSIKFIFNRIY